MLLLILQAMILHPPDGVEGEGLPAIEALQKMREWMSVLCGPPEDVQN